MAILRALQDAREGMSGRAIARQAEINHQTCAVALKNLEAWGILQRQGSGKTQFIRLNFKNYVIKQLILPLLRKERGLLKAIREDIVDTFRKEALSITLFGSVARGQEVTSSDVDVLLLVEPPAKTTLLHRTAQYSSDFMQRYGIRLSPVVFTPREARMQAKRSGRLFKNILRDGVDLLPRKLREVIS
ncbi:MAG: nucleotidyltransferase domain-containing protein [Elusimicrobia bacterium]|nr:nucleotidyltransferase domain-containing protein [Elusimicrobiota bacterium]